MRKILLATVALAAFALATPASAQIYIGPDGFRIGPLYVPNPDYYPPPPPPIYQPPPQVYQPPPVVVQPPPVVVQPPQQQYTVCWVRTPGLNIRDGVWGNIIAQVPFGTQLYLYGPPQYAWDGVPWYQITMGGWVSTTPLNCQ
jgi:hypothetical protein